VSHSQMWATSSCCSLSRSAAQTVEGRQARHSDGWSEAPVRIFSPLQAHRTGYALFACSLQS